MRVEGRGEGGKEGGVREEGRDREREGGSNMLTLFWSSVAQATCTLLWGYTVSCFSSTSCRLATSHLTTTSPSYLQVERRQPALELLVQAASRDSVAP